MAIPLAPFLVVVICFLGAIPFFTIMNAWIIDKSMDSSIAVLILVVILLCIVAMIAAFGSPLMWLILALLLGLNFTLPVLATVAGKRADRAMTNEDIERCQRVIARDPKNAAAHGFLGDAYLKIGCYQDAAEAYQAAVTLSPQTTQREKSQLRKALEKVTGESKQIEICPGCRAEQPAGRVKCEHCGHYMKGAYLLQKLSREAAPAGGVLLGGTLLGSALPPPVNGFVCLVALIGGCYLLWTKMKDD